MRGGEQRPQVGDALAQRQGGPHRGTLGEGRQIPVDLGVSRGRMGRGRRGEGDWHGPMLRGPAAAGPPYPAPGGTGESLRRRSAAQWRRGHTSDRGSQRTSRVPRPALGPAPGRVGPPAPPRPAQGDLAPRGAVLRVRRRHLRGEGAAPGAGPPRVRSAPPARGPGSALGAPPGPGGATLAGPLRGGLGGRRHPLRGIRLLVPGAALRLGVRRAAQPDARRLRRAAGGAALARLSLGRLLAVQRPLPLRRRSGGHDHGGCRDGAPLPRPQRWAAGGRPPADGGERRRGHGRPGRRARHRTSTWPTSSWERTSPPATTPCGGRSPGSRWSGATSSTASPSTPAGSTSWASRWTTWCSPPSRAGAGCGCASRSPGGTSTLTACGS